VQMMNTPRRLGAVSASHSPRIGRQEASQPLLTARKEEVRKSLASSVLSQLS